MIAEREKESEHFSWNDPQLEPLKGHLPITLTLFLSPQMMPNITSSYCYKILVFFLNYIFCKFHEVLYNLVNHENKSKPMLFVPLC